MNNDFKGIKIARVSTVAFFVDSQLHGQIKALVDTGAQIFVIASEDKLGRSIQGITYKSINIPRNISLIKDLCALVNLLFFFSREKIDIVHSTTPKAGLLCCIAGLLAGVKIRLHTYTGQTWASSNSVSSKFSRLSDWLISRLNSKCYADSYSQKIFLEKTKTVPIGSLSVLANGSLAGVDTARFTMDRFNLHDRNNIRNKLRVPLHSFVILFVGRCTRDKGIAELISSFSEIKKRFDDVVLIIVGPIEESGSKIISKASSDIQSQIIKVGFSENPESYIAISNVLAIPSYREGFGTVVIEAASMGIPAVGSDVYGLQDAIVNNFTGILVRPKDINALTEAIIYLINNSKKLEVFGNNAKKRAREKFDSDIVNNALVNEYVRLVNNYSNKFRHLP